MNAFTVHALPPRDAPYGPFLRSTGTPAPVGPGQLQGVHGRDFYVPPMLHADARKPGVTDPDVGYLAQPACGRSYAPPVNAMAHWPGAHCHCAAARRPIDTDPVIYLLLGVIIIQFLLFSSSRS